MTVFEEPNCYYFFYSEFLEIILKLKHMLILDFSLTRFSLPFTVHATIGFSD